MSKKTFKEAVSGALARGVHRHMVRLELDVLDLAQRDTLDKALDKGWHPHLVVDGRVILNHPNLESNLEIYPDGSHKRVKRVSVKA